MTKTKTHAYPHSEEAESMVIGQVMMDNDMFDVVHEFLPHENVFYKDFHKALWKSIISMRKKGTPIDAITLVNDIGDVRNGSEGSPAYYITGLMGDVVTTANAKQYAEIVYKKWLMRNIIRKSAKVQFSLHGSVEESMDALKKLNREIEDILNIEVQKIFDLDTLVNTTIENMFDTDNLISLGYDKLDNLTGGMTRGEITVIAGRPGHFKSTMMINIVRKLVRNGKKVLVFNREMSNIEMMKKIVILESENLSAEAMRLGNFIERDGDDVEKAKSKISEHYKQLIMFDNLFDIDSALREIRKIRPDVVVDDYIGLVDVKGTEDPRHRIDTIMKEYKRACKTYGMSAILLSQLNRECENRTNKRPIMRDLRDSGSIEQDAEMILFMYYDWRYYYEDSENGEYGIEIVLGKNRYGKTGSVYLGVAGDRCAVVGSPDDAMNETYKIRKFRDDNS
tara:strand:+ start:20129 stop:21481 length:1353 start_codon:yes stop_codon:yes gene_type:complete